MKKLLLLALIGLTFASESFGFFGRRNCGYNSCRKSCNYSCEAEETCGPRPCCVREQTITVQEPARKVCGWVCPDGCREIPASEARTIQE